MMSSATPPEKFFVFFFFRASSSELSRLPSHASYKVGQRVEQENEAMGFNEAKRRCVTCSCIVPWLVSRPAPNQVICHAYLAL